ncbi:NUDIX domain-containing protein [Blastococcus sp. TF02-8]|uniref:NUDIX domain-containing protein n=1 Tax=Blastococcus sp. TF02-8 TaxID=2250574 RepID=UPI00197A8E11|nr:NUDIX domain-containing protein [Blastococcus sp. TF02-8]
MTTPEDRLATLRQAVADETEPLVTVTHLLRLCRDEHSVLWSRTDDPVCCARVDHLLTELSRVLPAPGMAADLAPEVRAALADALEPVDDTPVVVVARALAEMIDERYGHTFSASFARRSPYQPRVGDPLPLDSPDLRVVTALPPTPPPWRLANRLDGTRRLRLAGEWATQFRVIFDYSAMHLLNDLVTTDTVVATCHPNVRMDEIRLPQDQRGRSFPVGPADLDAQRSRIDSVISAAVAAGASIVVLPELCVTEALAWELSGWVRRADGPRVLVAGSYHHEDPPPGASAQPARRRNTAVAWVRGLDRPLLHDKHSPADQPVDEDLQPDGWPELRIHVTADGWHLALAICRDLLNPHALQALTEAGANLVLVPAMSETLVPFGGPVGQLVGDDQALVVVANNPAQWPWPGHPVVHRPARALFGHPGYGQLTRSVSADDSKSGVVVLQVHSGDLRWLPVEASATEHGDLQLPGDELRARATPAWAHVIARQVARVPFDEQWSPTVHLRNAAVLVLVIDRPDGLRVLMTRRTRDLVDYPGEMVFPGGAADSGDDGPVGTALREATEETGLNPSSVQVLGMLPRQALVESGFLVTPVLAWSADPAFPRGTNLAEVDTLAEVPLGDASPDGVTAADSGRFGRMTVGLLRQLETLLRDRG